MEAPQPQVTIAPVDKRCIGNHGLSEGIVSREGGAADRFHNVVNIHLKDPAAGASRILQLPTKILGGFLRLAALLRCSPCCAVPGKSARFSGLLPANSLVFW
jgi:hypothetical protein